MSNSNRVTGTRSATRVRADVIRKWF